MAKRKLSRTDTRTSGGGSGRKSGGSTKKRSSSPRSSGEGRSDRNRSDKPFDKRRTSSRFGGDESGERPKRNFSRGDSPSGARSFDKKRPFNREGGDKKFSRGFSADSKPRRGFPEGFKREEGSEDRPKRTYRMTDGGGRSGGFKKDSDRPFDKRRSSDDRGDRPKRNFSDDRPRGNAERPFGKKPFDREERPRRASSGDNEERPRRNYRKEEGGDFKPREERSFGKKPFDREERPKRSFSGDQEDKPRRAPRREESAGEFKPREEKPFGKRPFDREERPKRSFSGDQEDKPKRAPRREEDAGEFKPREEKPFARKRSFDNEEEEKPRRIAAEQDDETSEEKPLARKRSLERAPNEDPRDRRPRKIFSDNKSSSPKGYTKREDEPAPTQIRLNRYLANSGVSSRREADEIIKMGLVTVNGTTITEMGYQVQPGDVVKHEGKMLRAEKPVYILMNKPKGFLTTTKDPEERNTVMHIIGSAVKERIYPVGRLDRNTTGLLLLTNDGALTEQLSHPSYNVKKIYKVELDRPLARVDFEKIGQGVQLEEGRAMVDDIAIVSDDGKTVGLEIHIGWNRVVRRIFESLEYQVVKLDRTIYAGMDKKDLSRGQWRFLKEEEVIRLKHLKKGTK